MNNEEFYAAYTADEEYVKETLDFITDRAKEQFDAGEPFSDVYHEILDDMLASVDNSMVYFAVLVTSIVMDRLVEGQSSGTGEADEA